MDANMRLIRYFVAVAEDLHFSQAADRVGVSQPALSRYVRKLEDGLGVQLLTRDTRNVALTAAGEGFLADMQDVLARYDAAIVRAQAVDRRMRGELRVGFFGNGGIELTPPILRAFRLRFPRIRISLHEFDFTDPTVGLASRRVDIGFVRPPLGLPQLALKPLFVEPRIVRLAAAHPLAHRPRLHIADLLHHPVVAAASRVPVSRDWWMGIPDRDGVRPRIGHQAGTPQEIMAAVGANVGLTLNPGSSSRYYPVPGVVDVPVTGVEPSAVALAWARDRPSDLTAAFVHSAVHTVRAEAFLPEHVRPLV